MELELRPDDPLFGSAVQDALKDVRFTPAEINGNPVPYWVILKFVFSIGDHGTIARTERHPARAKAPILRQPSVGR